DLPAVREMYDNTVPGALHLVSTRVFGHGRTALREHFLQHGRGVGVLVGQHPVTTGDDGDLDTHFGVRGGELGAGDSRPHHREVLRKFRKIIELAPVEDTFTVRDRSGQHSWCPSRGDQDGVRSEYLVPFGAGHRHLVGGHARLIVAEAREPVEHPNSRTLHPRPDIGRLGQRQTTHPAVHRGEVDAGVGKVGLDTELSETVQTRAGTGGGDERLRRYAVGEDAGATETILFDEGDLRTVLRGDQRGLVACRSPTHNDDLGHRILLQLGRLPPPYGVAARTLITVILWTCPCMPPTAPTWSRPGWPNAHRTRRWPEPAGWRDGDSPSVARISASTEPSARSSRIRLPACSSCSTM